MSMRRSVEFDFSTPGDWTLAGDCEISGGALSLEDPFVPLYIGPNHWTPEFDVDPVTLDAILLSNTVHKALDGGTDLAVDDGIYVFWIKQSSGIFTGQTVRFRLRYDVLLSGDYFAAQLVGVAGGKVEMKMKDSASQPVFDDAESSDDWAIGSWRQILLWIDGDVVKYQLGGKREQWYRQMILTDEGSFAIEQGFTGTEKFYIAANTGEVGHPSDHPCPYVCHKRTGSCELNEGSAFEFPDGSTNLGTIAPSHRVEWTPTLDSPPGDGAYVGAFAVDLAYQIHDGASWSSWVEVPADGDLSAVSVEGGYKFRLGIRDGSGGGMTNGPDPRYVPVLDRVVLTYDQDLPIVGMRSNVLIGGPNRGAGE